MCIRDRGSVWSRLGSEVTILEALPDFLSVTDIDVAKEAAKVFAKQGLNIQLGVQIGEVKASKKGVSIAYTDKDGKAQKLDADRLIVSVGRIQMCIRDRTTFNEVNMAPIMALRTQYGDKFEKAHGVRLGFMGFFVKAAVAALQKFPIINASVDGNDIVYHGYIDIGIAVGSPRGLVVPILRDADQMSIADIEKSIGEFGQKAKDGKLSMEDLTGGTFSISNGGIFGSMPVSYTHLDVYKRQPSRRPIAARSVSSTCTSTTLLKNAGCRLASNRSAARVPTPRLRNCVFLSA